MKRVVAAVFVAAAISLVVTSVGDAFSADDKKPDKDDAFYMTCQSAVVHMEKTGPRLTKFRIEPSKNSANHVVVTLEWSSHERTAIDVDASRRSRVVVKTAPEGGRDGAGGCVLECASIELDLGGGADK